MSNFQLNRINADAVAGSFLQSATFFVFQSVIFSAFFLAKTGITYERNTPVSIREGSSGFGCRADDF